MIPKFLILIPLFALQSTFGQTAFARKAFYSHFQTCHGSGTTEQDYVIELFNDSTLKISVYTSSYPDYYGTVSRLTYLGNYCFKNDTVNVNFSNYTSCTKKKYQKKTNQITEKANKHSRYPSSSYIIKGNQIISIDNFFPCLKAISPIEIKKIDIDFETWDSNTLAPKKIFGLYDY